MKAHKTTIQIGKEKKIPSISKLKAMSGAGDRAWVRPSDADIATSVKALKVGESYYISNDYNRDRGGMLLAYRRLSAEDAAAKRATRNKEAIDRSAPVSGKAYGTTCPACGEELVEVLRSTTSDGGHLGLQRHRELWHYSRMQVCWIRSCSLTSFVQLKARTCE
jgi:hypothetical protein